MNAEDYVQGRPGMTDGELIVWKKVKSDPRTIEVQPCVVHLPTMTAHPADGMYDMLDEYGDEYTEAFLRAAYASGIRFREVREHGEHRFMFVRDDQRACARREALVAECEGNQLSLLDALRTAKEALMAIRQDFIEAIGYDPHEDECSIWQETIEDIDHAIVVTGKAIANVEGD